MIYLKTIKCETNILNDLIGGVFMGSEEYIVKKRENLNESEKTILFL